MRYIFMTRARHATDGARHTMDGDRHITNAASRTTGPPASVVTLSPATILARITDGTRHTTSAGATSRTVPATSQKSTSEKTSRFLILTAQIRWGVNRLVGWNLRGLC